MAQTSLANETTELVHGGKISNIYDYLRKNADFLTLADGLRKAVTATRVLFGGDLSTLSGDHIIEAFKTDTNRFVQLERSSVIGSGLDKIASITNAAKSKCKCIFLVTHVCIYSGIL